MKLTFDDAEYTLSPLGMGLLLKAEKWLKQHDTTLADAAQQLSGGIDPVAKSVILDVAFRHWKRSISMSEVGDWLESPEGFVFALWKSLEVFHKDMPHEEAVSVFDRMSATQYDQVRELLYTNGIYQPPQEDRDAAG